ncbi:hypothetical protein C8R43DRAFT_959689 [Mycena crocata]|nr:hypothetical protein C8R43DRAFT_959689 [Mycena crocata]
MSDQVQPLLEYLLLGQFLFFLLGCKRTDRYWQENGIGEDNLPSDMEGVDSSQDDIARAELYEADFAAVRIQSTEDGLGGIFAYMKMGEYDSFITVRGKPTNTGHRMTFVGCITSIDAEIDIGGRRCTVITLHMPPEATGSTRDMYSAQVDLLGQIADVDRSYCVRQLVPRVTSDSFARQDAPSKVYWGSEALFYTVPTPVVSVLEPIDVPTAYRPPFDIRVGDDVTINCQLFRFDGADDTMVTYLTQVFVEVLHFVCPQSGHLAHQLRNGLGAQSC